MARRRTARTYRPTAQHDTDTPGRVVHRETFESLEELADAAARGLSAYHTHNRPYIDQDWHGVDSFEEAQTLARDGWLDETAEAMAIAESAVSSVETALELPTFHPVWDVTGAEVDVARYLDGEPENMIDYEQVPTTRYGRVITLCASGSISGAVSTDTIKRRGQTVAALAYALVRMGYATELWIDHTVSNRDETSKAQTRVLVKGAHDELDAARVMFAYAHPAELRALVHPSRHNWPTVVQDAIGLPFSMGVPQDPIRDLPEGTIYLPALQADTDVPDAAVALVRYLRELGIVPESEKV